MSRSVRDGPRTPLCSALRCHCPSIWGARIRLVRSDPASLLDAVRDGIFKAPAFDRWLVQTHSSSMSCWPVKPGSWRVHRDEDNRS
jgi:hypothetical protein